MNEKFGRLYELIIFPPSYAETVPGSDPSKFSFNNFGFDEIVTIKNPFTLTFNIKREAFASTQIGTFQIYNLGETTRNLIYKDPAYYPCYRRMIFKAGYSHPLPVVFSGNILQCTSCRPQGQTNFITEIQSNGFDFPIKNSFTNQNFDGRVDKQHIINHLVDDIVAMGSPDANLNLTRGNIHQYSDVQYNRIVSGYSWDILKEETDNNCFIDNGKIHILDDNEYIDGLIGEINSSTGLLGSPKRDESHVIAEVLFEPNLVVGQKVTLDSVSQKIFNGDYKVYGLNHFGVISDAVGGRCQTNVMLYNFNKLGSLLQPIVG